MMARSPLFLIPGAMVLAACAFAGTLPMTPGVPPLPGAPVERCSLVLIPDADGSSLVIRGRIAPGPAIAGDYSLAITGRGNTVRQSGDFAVPVGREGNLAEARLSGKPADYTANLTLNIAGRTVDCPVR
jgi:hypothetical protein